MKKSLLLLVAGAMAVSASAQDARPASILFNHTAATINPNPFLGKKITVPQERAGVPDRRSAARTTSITGTPVYTETFPPTVLTSGGSGGVTDIWTTGSLGTPATGVWHETTVASTSSNMLPALASTTASNGWMIFDCDSLYDLSSTFSNLPGAYLQSPAINCTGLATVGLSFQQLFQGGAQDTCYIGVSTSSTFATATYYPIAPNSNLFAYDRTANPDTVNLNITSAAAGHTVYIRFIYKDQMYWGFSWQIDDVAVGALAPHDVGLYHNFMYQSNGSATAGAEPSSIYERPLIFVDNLDSIAPVVLLSNYANTVETVPMTANIYNGSSSVYSQSATYTGLSINALDSIVQFPNYAPNSVGQYTCAFDAALTTDADPANNIDTTTFDIDDTTWNDNYGQLFSDYVFAVYGTGTTPFKSFQGARFDVPPNIAVPGAGIYPSDTVSSFSVSFASNSAPTGSGKVTVQLYSVDPTNGLWTFQGESVPRKLTATDYSTSSGIAYATFPTFTGYGPYIDPVVMGGNFVLQANTTYAAVVQTSGVTTDLFVNATTVPAPTYFNVGYLGLDFPSNNDGAADFGTTTAVGATYVPLINMNFGHIPTQRYNVGVQNVALDNSIGQPFPNPSNASFTIPFTMAQDNKVTVTLTDMLGQVVNTQTIITTGGQTATAVFNTTNLAEGIYLYTVQANGVNTTGRVVVAH